MQGNSPQKKAMQVERFEKKAEEVAKKAGEAAKNDVQSQCPEILPGAEGKGRGGEEELEESDEEGEECDEECDEESGGCRTAGSQE